MKTAHTHRAGRRARVIAAGAIAIGLFASACSDDDKSSSTTAAPTTEAMVEMDIVDTAVAAGDFTVLAEALTAADLIDALKADGPFTVFAPTDDAFVAALGALGMTKEELFADKELLTSVLTYHVVEGKVLAADAIALDGKSAATLNGAEIAISVVDGSVKLNDTATVVTADIMASNGVIHVIDSVLLPPASEEGAMAEKDIVDTAIEAGTFTLLAEALTAAGLVDALKGEGPFTVFAPTDDAIVAALTALGITKEQLFADKALLTSVLTYHVIEGKVLAADAIALDGKSAATLNGAELAISVMDGSVMLNGDTMVVTADIMASNGVIHVIDKVLLPPAP